MTLRDDYNRDGYVVIKPDYNIEFSHAAIISKFGELKSIFDSGREGYIAFLSLMARDIEWMAFFSQPNLIATLRYFCGKSPFISSYPILHVMGNYLRIDEGYNETPAHQDWPSTQGSMDAITMWIPLTETKGNFPLEVIPGSHKAGLLGGESDGNVTEVSCDENDFIEVDCSRWDVIIMSSFLVHRTGKGGDGLRVAVSMRFDNADEPTFIERGYPCAQKRVVDRGVRWKPTVDQVRAVFK